MKQARANNGQSGAGTAVVALILIGLLAACSAVAAYLWFSLEGVEISTHGWIAMTAGIVLSLIIGGGLMALVFFSARRGYDDRV